MAPFGVDEIEGGIDKGTFGPLVKPVQVGCERVRLKPVVGIEKDQVMSARRPPAGIARRSQSLVGLADQPDLRVAAHHRARVVGRAVVDDDHFIRSHALPKSALDRVGPKTAHGYRS